MNIRADFTLDNGIFSGLMNSGHIHIMLILTLHSI